MESKEKDHNFEYLACPSNHSGRLAPSVDRRECHEKVMRVVERLNQFHAEHGRMPSQSELPAITGEETAAETELTYEIDNDLTEQDVD